MYSRRPEHETESAYDLFARGIGLLSDGHPHQAAMLLGRAKLLEPDKGSIREALGRALYMAGRAMRARHEFTKAVQIDPANDYAHFGLALACARTGQRERAIGHLKLAIAMRPGVEHYELALSRIAG
ncbi:MAG: tetratricopeptide repeat protein [Actinomycetota bacterium]|jgi:Flp pilus assembly protein TadD